jgi:hypothetical protein
LHFGKDGLITGGPSSGSGNSTDAWENGLAISKKRAALLRELEGIVGRSCYNSKTQNWGPGGRFEGEGRAIRYPITFTDAKDVKIKRRSGYEDLPPAVQMTGSYIIGVNELRILKSLDKVLQYLEEKHGLKI